MRGLDVEVRKCNIPSDGQGQPQEEDKLEGVVEGEPVDNAQQALEDTVHAVSQGLPFWDDSEDTDGRRLT